MKTLHFSHAGNDMACSLEYETLGRITQSGEQLFPGGHPTWRITGFSKAHYRISPETPIHPSIKVEQVDGGIVFESDGGLHRKWTQLSAGRIARARYAYVVDMEAVKKFAADRKAAMKSFDAALDAALEDVRDAAREAARAAYAAARAAKA